jgi:hypothetical protein
VEPRHSGSQHRHDPTALRELNHLSCAAPVAASRARAAPLDLHGFVVFAPSTPRTRSQRTWADASLLSYAISAHRSPTLGNTTVDLTRPRGQSSSGAAVVARPCGRCSSGRRSPDLACANHPLVCLRFVIEPHRRKRLVQSTSAGEAVRRGRVDSRSSSSA